MQKAGNNDETSSNMAYSTINEVGNSRHKKRIVLFLVLLFILGLGGAAYYYYMVNRLPLREYTSEAVGVTMLKPEGWHKASLDQDSDIDEIEVTQMGASSFFGGLVTITENPDVNDTEESSREQIIVQRYDTSNNPITKEAYFQDIDRATQARQGNIHIATTTKDTTVDGYSGKLVVSWYDSEYVSDNDELSNPMRSYVSYIYVSETMQYKIMLFAVESGPLDRQSETILDSIQINHRQKQT